MLWDLRSLLIWYQSSSRVQLSEYHSRVKMMLLPALKWKPPSQSIQLLNISFLFFFYFISQHLLIFKCKFILIGPFHHTLFIRLYLPSSHCVDVCPIVSLTDVSLTFHTKLQSVHLNQLTSCENWELCGFDRETIWQFKHTWKLPHNKWKPNSMSRLFINKGQKYIMKIKVSLDWRMTDECSDALRVLLPEEPQTAPVQTGLSSNVNQQVSAASRSPHLSPGHTGAELVWGLCPQRGHDCYSWQDR